MSFYFVLILTAYRQVCRFERGILVLTKGSHLGSIEPATAIPSCYPSGRSKSHKFYDIPETFRSPPSTLEEKEQKGFVLRYVILNWG